MDSTRSLTDANGKDIDTPLSSEICLIDCVLNRLVIIIRNPRDSIRDDDDSVRRARPVAVIWSEHCLPHVLNGRSSVCRLTKYGNCLTRFIIEALSLRKKQGTLLDIVVGYVS